MTKESETFFARWSRLKREGGAVEQAPAPVPEPTPGATRPAEARAADVPLPELPPVDQLTPDSDFRPFMDPRVPEALRRMALRKLYADPHFNVQDMLDDYAGDYTLLETLPAGMAGKLAHARRTLLGRDEADRIEAEERQVAEKTAEEAASAPPQDAAEAPRISEAPDRPGEHAQSHPSGETQKDSG